MEVKRYKFKTEEKASELLLALLEDATDVDFKKITTTKDTLGIKYVGKIKEYDTDETTGIAELICESEEYYVDVMWKDAELDTWKEFIDELFTSEYSPSNPFKFVKAPTCEDLYREKTLTAEKLFTAYETKLAQASILYLVKGDVPEGLKQLSVGLEAVKLRIKEELDTALENQELEHLQAFSFTSEESLAEQEYLTNAIKSFK